MSDRRKFDRPTVDDEDQVTGCPTGENLTDRPFDAEDQVTGCPTGENLTDRPRDICQMRSVGFLGENLGDFCEWWICVDFCRVLGENSV